MNILNIDLRQKYTRPDLFPIDVDIRSMDENSTSRINIFQSVLNKDYDSVKEYSDKKNIETNVFRQTPLMLACLCRDYICCCILMNEAGQVDLLDKCAMDYANLRKQDEVSVKITELLSKFENII